MNRQLGYWRNAMIALSLSACALLFSITNVSSQSIILQSTTSTQNSGLFSHILPRFQFASGITVKVVAVGTGQALKNGRNGDGDVLLVHAKSAEKIFVEEGYGVKRHDVMYNDFVLIGPADDPARVAMTNDILSALQQIHVLKTPFVSRGDDSGTNRMELGLWKSTDIEVGAESGSWYLESGSGMGATLNIATAMGAYTLSDRATWAAFANKKNMKILSEGDPLLFNQYGIILVNAKKHPHTNSTDGQSFIDWITGPDGQAAIASFTLGGRQMFFPNATTSSNEDN